MAIHVAEGTDKPYKCKDGFFIRNGPNSQKLRRDEIIALIHQYKNHYYDEQCNEKFIFPADFSQERLDHYKRIAGINTTAVTTDLLVSLGVVAVQKEIVSVNNAGVLFFAKEPTNYFREAFITCVKYKSNDRFSILDRKDIGGSLIEQIEHAMQFVIRHMDVETQIANIATDITKHRDVYEYSLIAVREAIINAVAHRDYYYGNSHIYIHMYPGYIDFENPGGLIGGLTVDDLGKRSIRRNPLIADLLYRAGYIERVGSGFDRMRIALAENKNPPLQVNVTSFFNLRFFKRIAEIIPSELSTRQLHLFQAFKDRVTLTKHQAALILDISDDTALRDIQALMAQGLVERNGQGKATIYNLVK